MIKTKQGLSQRGYARHAGVALSYVQKLLDQGKLPVLRDGSLDPVACDTARSHNTVMGRGQRRLGHFARENEPAGLRNAYLDCDACGESYGLLEARAAGTPDPMRYCTPKCQTDAEDGLTRAQIRRRISREARA